MGNQTRKKWEISRRTFLKCGLGGAGTLVGLPLLEAMMPRLAQAGYNGSTAPTRYVATFAPHGVAANFFPLATGRGSAYSLSGTSLAPLQDNKSYLSIYQGMSHTPDQHYGHHSSSFLSSRDSAELSSSGHVTVDQVIADNHVAKKYLGIRSIHLAGYINYGSGYGFSTRSDGTANPHTLNPRTAFDSLVSGLQIDTSAAQANLRAQRKTSVLDFVKSDLQRLGRLGLGIEDRKRLDQYFTSVREIEQQIQFMQEVAGCNLIARPAEGLSPDGGTNIAQGLENQNLCVMADILVMALTCDLTRVATFGFGLGATHDLTNFTVNTSQMGISQGYHAVAHYQGSNLNRSECEERISRVDRLHTETLNYLFNRMRLVQEGPANLLDNSMVLFSSEHSVVDGGHYRSNLGFLIGGRGGGAINPDFHVKIPESSPGRYLSNIHVASIGATGGSQSRFAASTGTFDLKTGTYQAIS